MSDDVYIFETSESGFDELVLQNSYKLPVITLFMGSWSEHCFALSERFSLLAKEFAGQFILAKIDIDEYPGLRDQFKISNIPTTKIFQAGEEVLTSEGLLTEDEARILLKGVQVFHLADAMREKARKLHLGGDTQGAIILLSQAIQKDPSNTNVALDMVQIFIDIQEIEQAEALFNKLPESARNTDMGKTISVHLAFINLAATKPSIDELNEILANNAEDTDARFDLAICLTAAYDYAQATEQLLALYEQDPEYKEGAGKELLITVISMLKTNAPELAKSAQVKFSNISAG